MADTIRKPRNTNRDKIATERKQQILDAAKRLFADHGYHETSMRSINKLVGMSDTLTYHHFPGGKLEILHAVMRDAQEKRIRSIDAFVQSIKEDMPLRDVLLIVARQFSAMNAAHEPVAKILIREKDRLDQELWAFFQKTAQQPLDAIVAYLTKQMEQGNIRELDYRLAIRQFVYHFIVPSVLGFDFLGEDPQRYIERIVDFTLKLWEK